MLHRIISYFRRQRPDIETIEESIDTHHQDQVINPQVFSAYNLIPQMPLPSTANNHASGQAQQVPVLPINLATSSPINPTSMQPNNPRNHHDQNISRNRHLERRRREDFTPKQIQRMITRDTKLINEFAVLTSGTAILAYNSASVPGFTLDPCMVQSSATFLGGLFFLYYIHISDMRYTRYFDNRLVKVGILCILLSGCCILINIITAALNYNSRFWMIGSTTAVCVVPNGVNSTTTTSAIGTRKHSNALFVFCYFFCLLISLLPFLRLLVIVLDTWSTNNQHEDREEEHRREHDRLEALDRDARVEAVRTQAELTNRANQITRLEGQLNRTEIQNRALRELYAHHGPYSPHSHRTALDLVHIDGSCQHVHAVREPTSSRAGDQSARRVSFRAGADAL